MLHARFLGIKNTTLSSHFRFLFRSLFSVITGQEYQAEQDYFFPLVVVKFQMIFYSKWRTFLFSLLRFHYIIFSLPFLLLLSNLGYYRLRIKGRTRLLFLRCTCSFPAKATVSFPSSTSRTLFSHFLRVHSRLLQVKNTR